MFSLRSFKVTHKNNILYDCRFIEDNSVERTQSFTTLLIGENGVGKSFLLSTIVNFIRWIHTKPKSSPFKLKYDCIELSYYIDDVLYNIEKNNTVTNYLKNGSKVDKEDVVLPSKLLALSFMVNDKFSYSNLQESEGFYKYLGVRATSNATYTSSIQKRLLSSLIQSFKDVNRLQSLKKVFEFIGIGKEFNISYKLKRKTLYKKKLTPEFLAKKIGTINSRKKYINEYKIKDIDALTYKIINFIEELKFNKVLTDSGINYWHNLSNNNVEEYKKQHTMLIVLENLELISSPEIQFVKEDVFDFEHTSSGEKHFIYTMINLIANVEKDSLIFIDEPELSLHPRWQMNYVKMLKEILVDFKCCHCVLASHSHFMVSDLEPTSSSLVSLQKNYSNNMELRRSNLIKYDTYAWSAENILYEVFKLRTTRNYYFEQNLTEILTLVSVKSDDKVKISDLYKKIRSYTFDKNDPVNLILNQVDDYLEGI
jgi:predicted ATPase